MDFDLARCKAYAWLPSMLETLEELVRQESPSHEKQLLDQLAENLASRFRTVGGVAEILAHKRHAHHVRVAFGDTTAPDKRPALLLCHFDTVWSEGTLSRMPFRIQDGKAWGPGVLDMKAGIVIVEYALRLLSELQISLARPVVLLMNSDEEIGSGSSRAIIEAQAKQAEYALVLEPANPGGALKTARKGVGAFTLEVEGRAAHAGSEPEKGINAIVELAHHILYLDSLNDRELGTTLNVGVIQGGTRSNVVAAHATARVDVRAWTLDEARRIEGLIRNLPAHNPEVKTTVSGGFGRSPMERLPGTVELFRRVQAIGAHLGLELSEGSSGGGSDGNFCAALGIPTLDGMGALGEGAHADHEQVEIASLPERTVLLAAVLAML